MNDINYEHSVPFACPQCPRGLVNMYDNNGNPGWRCDKCGTEWEDNLDIRKEHINNFLDEVLKSGNKAQVVSDFDELSIVIKSIKYSDTEIDVEDKYIQYLDSHDSLDELHDYTLGLIEKFGIETEYIDLTTPTNPIEECDEYGAHPDEDQSELNLVDIDNFEDFINQAQLIPFPASTIDSIEYYNNPTHNIRKFMGYITDDFEFAKALNKARPELHIYTLVEGDDDRMYIIDGVHWVNRIGYCFGLKKLENIEIEY